MNDGQKEAQFLVVGGGVDELDIDRCCLCFFGSTRAATTSRTAARDMLLAPRARC